MLVLMELLVPWYRLLNCLQEDGKLFLVFEFVDKDLKRYMEHKLGALDPSTVKVRLAL